MINLIIILALAGLTAGLVNFFYIYLSLPVIKDDEEVNSLSDDKKWAIPKLTWKLALSGYIVIGIAGAFLTPLIHAIVTLKGLDATLDKSNLVIFGYGLIFGFCSVRTLSNISNSILNKIELLYKQNNGKESLNASLFNYTSFPLENKENETCIDANWEKAPNYSATPLKTMKWVNGLSKDKFGCTRNGGNKFHGGIDLDAIVGTECYAIADGVISDIGFGTEVGKFIALQFEVGDKKYGAGYCHLDEIMVKKGDTVKSGQQIGKTGKTGNVGSDKAHLHLEIHKNKWLTYSSAEERSKASLNPNHYVV